MRIDPLQTRHPVTGATRPVTAGLLREVYLAPKTGDLDLAAAIAGLSAPWSASFAAAPAETAQVVGAALRALAEAAPALDPDEVRPNGLPEGRAKDHLVALHGLWQRLEGALPEDMAAVRHVLRSQATDAVVPLPVLDPLPCRFASPAELALQARLLAHHGAAPEAARILWQAGQPPATATASGALGHVQAALATATPPVAPDATLTVWGLRDPVEEAAFAAGLAQRTLDNGTVAAPAEIGLLVPEDVAFPDHLAAAFDAAGLALSGLPLTPARRDTAGEVLLCLLRLLEGPAPRMALAGVFSSPLMPWTAAQGATMAREVMEHGSTATARGIAAAVALLAELSPPVRSPAQLHARLAGIDAMLDPAPDRAEDRAAFRTLLGVLRATLSGDTPDWPAARRIAGPRACPPGPPDRFVEGVSLFDGGALPWRSCRHLIVLGFAGDNWPRPVSANPMFLDRELGLIRQVTGLALPTRSDILARRLDLFRRQLCAASDGATFLVTAMNARGERLAPATALALLARATGVAKPADLIRDLRAVEPSHWPVPHRLAEPLPQGGAPDLPTNGILPVGGDLMRLRREADGRAKPQSPSRLETLVISPLAWTLQELGAQPVVWAPEALDVLTLGSLAHHVLEHMFPKDAPLPGEAAIDATLDARLDAAIAREAPFLAGVGWAAERASLRREMARVCHGWRRRLAVLDATVIENEIRLAGEGLGIRLSGRADCILRLGDGRLVIVDHKRSSSRGREKRMERGCDLQVALYRAMLERPETAPPPDIRPGPGDAPGVAYHLMNDGRVLSHGLPGVPGFDDLANDISARVMDLLTDRIVTLGGGRLPLNRAGDAARFDKDCSITAYALKDNPFLDAFTLPEPVEADDV